MFSQLQIATTELLCKEGNKVTRACINPECPVSLICGLEECACCGGDKHEDCPSVNFGRLPSLLNRRVDKYKEFVDSLFEIEDKFIETLCEKRKEAAIKSYAADLSEK